MVARTRWTLRMDGLLTRLAIGTGRRPTQEPVEVGLQLQVLADVVPDAREQRVDLDAICDWITNAWPLSAPTALLEARTVELMDHVFRFDRRVQQVTVVLVRRIGDLADGARIAIEREATRAQFESQQRMAGTPRVRNGRGAAAEGP